MIVFRKAVPFLVAGALLTRWSLGPRLSGAQAATVAETPDPDDGAHLFHRCQWP